MFRAPLRIGIIHHWERECLDWDQLGVERPPLSPLWYPRLVIVRSGIRGVAENENMPLK